MACLHNVFLSSHVDGHFHQFLVFVCNSLIVYFADDSGLLHAHMNCGCVWLHRHRVYG